MEYLDQCTGRFMSYHSGYGTPFAPALMWNLWHQNYPQAVPHMQREMVTPCAHEIALGESNPLLADKSL